MNLKNVNKPYPYTSELSVSLKTISYIGLFVFLFVLIFRSDALTENASFLQKIKISFCYGIIAFLLPLINTIVINAFMTKEKELSWKVKHEIFVYILHFTAISIGNYVVSAYLLNNQMNMLGFIQSIGITVLIGSIPVSIHILNMQKKLLKKHVETAEKIKETGDTEIKHASSESPILNICGTDLNTRHLAYIESDKNYLQFIFTDKKNLRIRYTLKELEKKIKNIPEFIRCHRAFIVNINKIKKAEGNAQGLKLFFHDLDTHIPVSRRYIPKIKEYTA